MCIVATKPKGIDATAEFFDACRTAALKNRDGIGFALKREGEGTICMMKGMYKEAGFVDHIEENLDVRKNDELIFHARIRTSGNINAENCHPFLISDNDDIINTIEGDKIEYPVLAHNGIFFEFSHARDNFSDTYSFIKDFLACKFGNDIIERCHINENMEKFIFGYNKVAIMFPDKNKEMFTFGDFITDFNGCKFSNTMYKKYLYESTVTDRNVYDGYFD